MTEMEIEQARYQIIIKSNALIQKSQFDLSALQQKVILYLISKISPYDEDFKTYEFNIMEFCQVCGIDHDSGGNYKMLKKVIKELADKSIWVNNPEEEYLGRIICDPVIKKKKGTIQLKLHDYMKPHLLQQKARYTQYEFIWGLQLEKKYSGPLYELAVSIHYNDLKPYEYIFDLDELRRIMGATNYKTWQHFKDRALDPAVQEINSFTNKIIEYEPIKYGRVVGRVKIKVTTKDIFDALHDKRL